MSEWREVVLGDLCERVTVGHVGKMATQYVEQGVPFLRSQNVRPFVIDTKGLLFIGDEFNAKLRKSALAAGDVVVVRTGYPGTASVIPEDLDGANCADLVVITPSDRLNPHVLAGLFNSVYGQQTVKSQLVGSAQQHFNVGSAKAMKVRLPDRVGQDRIAEVLCSLNDLIENTRRRVAALEEMARAIYREWFVKFRYPGHGEVPMVDSALGPIPQGWRAGTIGEVLELKYGKALKASARRGGDVAVVSSAGIVGWHDESFVSGPAIVVGRKGNVGSIHWVDGPCWPIDTAYYVDTALPLRFVAEQLRRTEFTNTHAAVPGLSREGAYSRPFLVPSSGVLEVFQTAVDPLGVQATALGRQSDSLAALRDLLLPRLVTGQIDVSALDLGALVEGAVA